jgi:phage protein U
MAKLTMDEGEYATATIDLSGLPAPWDDLTGATITLSAEDKATGTAMALVPGVLDAAGADGKIHGGYAVIPAWTRGTYFCTLEVVKAGTGWPQKQSFDLDIERVAKKPAPP